MRPRLAPLGDSAVLIQLGDEIEPALNRRVHGLERIMRRGAQEGIIETVPAYASLLVHYDPLVVDYDKATKWIREVLDEVDDQVIEKPRKLEVPVRYGGQDGPDLGFVAQYHRLTPRRAAEIHASGEYLIYMMGFTPGFPYMGILDEGIATPRLDTPRTHVPAGSVGIAGAQTGIYPVESPGGWRLIGKTSLSIFDPQADPPFIFSPGDTVRFVIEAVNA